MNKNILFFGASVTEQKNSYAVQFEKMSQVNKDNFNITIKGYGSTHLSDSGVTFIKELIDQYVPSYCFIDFFSTGFISLDTKTLYLYLDCLTYNLQSINCHIIYLLLDENDDDNWLIKKKQMHDLVKQYAIKYNIYIIDFFGKLENKKLYLRDSVHTNDNGSIYYGENVYNFFIKNVLNKPFIKYEVNKNYLCDIKKIIYSKKIYEKLTIKGHGEILQIYQLIGRFSSQVIITFMNTNNEQTTQVVDIWDVWAHYDRMVCKIRCPVNNQTIIEVSKETMNKEDCRNKHIDWSQYTNSYLDIKSIYYTGDIFIDEDNSY